MSSKPNPARTLSRRSRRTRRTLLALSLLAAAALAAAALLDWRRGGGERAQALPAAGATGTLTAGHTYFDLGRVSMRDGKVSHRYELRNESAEPALIEQIYTSCMCTEATLWLGTERVGPFGMPGHSAIPRINRVLQPGQTAAVEAVFDPKAHGPAGVGRNERVVSVAMGGRRTLELGFSAYVTP